jgi:hypothetical protein
MESNHTISEKVSWKHMFQLLVVYHFQHFSALDSFLLSTYVEILLIFALKVPSERFFTKLADERALVDIFDGTALKIIKLLHHRRLD